MNKLYIKIAVTLFTIHCSLFTVQAQLGLGVVNPHASAIFEAASTNKGMLMPRMTTTQQNAISGPATSLMIYNTDSSCYSYYDGAVWKYMKIGTASSGGDHTFYEITLPSTLTTTIPTSIANPVYRRGQAHFLSGTTTQDNNAFINIKPENNRPYGILNQISPIAGALSAGTQQMGIYSTLNLSGSTAYTNTLYGNYNYLNHTGTANTTSIRVAESDASFAGGTQADVIGTHSALSVLGGTLTLGRGVYGAVALDGTVSAGETRAVEGITYNNTNRTLTATSSQRGGLFQFVNYAGATVNTSSHIIGLQGGISNANAITVTGSGNNLASIWSDHANNATGVINNPGGSTTGIFNSNYNSGKITAANAFGIYSQMYNDSTITATGTVAGIQATTTNNTGNSITAASTVGGDFRVYNNGSITSPTMYGVVSGFGNNSSGSSITSTSEIAGVHHTINNVAGATMTTPSLLGLRAYITNTGTLNNSAGNTYGVYGQVYNNGTWTNCSAIRGGQFTIDNGASGNMTTTSALYANLTQINNSGTMTSPNLYANLGQINLNLTTNVSGEAVATYSDIANGAGSTANITAAYGTRNYVSNAVGGTMTVQTSMGTNSFIQNFGQYNVRDTGGMFGIHNYIHNAKNATINNNKPSTPGLYATYNYIDNYGTINGTGPMYGSYNFVRNRDTGTSSSNTMIGVEGYAQIYNTTHNRPVGTMIGGNFHSELNNYTSVPSSLTIANKWGIQGYVRRDGTNTTETVTDERGIYAYVYHDPNGTSNVAGGFAGIFNYDHNGAGTVTNSYGVHIQNSGSGAKTNAYGLYINAVTGTNKWGIYEVSGAKNYLAGRLGINASIPNSNLHINGEAANWTAYFDGSAGHGIYTKGNASGYYAIWAEGNTWSTTAWTSSDARLKTNIAKIEDGLATILKLNPVVYDKKQSLNSTNYDIKESGFLAQEIQKVIPYAVREGKSPEDSISVLGVNYTDVIPFLTKAIQELNAKVESGTSGGSGGGTGSGFDPKPLIDRLDSMKKELALYKVTNNTLLLKVQDYEALIKSCDLPCTKQVGSDPTLVAKLYQNFPNPFSTQTKIEYFLPEIKVSARMYFYDMSGKELSSSEVTKAGKGFVIVESGAFAAGQYLYTLISDGVEIGTKKMILTR